MLFTRLEQARRKLYESAPVPVERPATHGSRNSLSVSVVLGVRRGSSYTVFGGFLLFHSDVSVIFYLDFSTF